MRFGFNMASNFHFVPRSVSQKPAKPTILSRTRQTNFAKTISKTQKICSGPLEGNETEIKRENCNEGAQLECSSIESFGESSQSFGPRVVEVSCETNEEDSVEDTSGVVYFSKNQRWPENDEPICVVCGRFGEYICDQTEADVCSKECKARNLNTRQSANKEMSNVGNESANLDKKSIDASHSESFFIRKGLSASEESENYKYRVHPQVASLTEEQLQELRSRMEITISGNNIERPVMEFAHCGIDEQLLTNLKTCGYVTPTPVQMQAIPVGLTGRDLLTCAQTGSGKTAAFLLPLIIRIHYIASQQNCDNSSSSSIQGLVLAPTRELCMQIESQAKELMSGLANMRTALIVGGIPMPNQIYRLQQGVQIVFATPGRLAEILSKIDVGFSEIKMLVIDEVDVLMQMGFEKQVNSILEFIPGDRQTLLFSATIPPSVERVSSTLLTNPIWVSIGAPSAPNMDVKQVILWVEDKSKKKRLFALLNDSKYFTPPILVFVDSRLGADMLSEAVQETCNVRCTSMHGEKVQSERTQTLTAFLSGEFDVLVCTGVLGRGLDLRNVKQVINFDMPSSVDEYIHQIGRAGRLGSKGLAITFINNTNKAVFLDLVETVQPHGVKLPDELLNSPHLSRQQHEREHKRKNRKRRHEESYVNRENLMDILKKSTFRRRLKNR